MQIINWVAAHWGQAFVVLAALLTVLGTARNLLTYFGEPKAATWVGRVMDVLSWIVEHGKVGPFGGLLSLPGIGSKDPVERKEAET